MNENKHNLHRFVRILYNMRNPHVRQRTGSPPFNIWIAAQSPQRYSTPVRNGIAAPPAPADPGAPSGAVELGEAAPAFIMLCCFCVGFV